MRSDIEKVVDISSDLKIEPPRTVHAGLPNIAHRVIFFGSQRWMAEVLKKKFRLFLKSLPDLCWSFIPTPQKLWRIVQAH